MTSRAYLSSRAEGGFSDSVPSSRGEVDLRLAAPRAPGAPCGREPSPAATHPIAGARRPAPPGRRQSRDGGAS